MRKERLDYVDEKLSAGRITNGRRVYDPNGRNDAAKTVTSVYQTRFDMDLIPSGRYIIRCYVDCTFQSENSFDTKELKTPKGYCSFTTGRCQFEDENGKIKPYYKNIPGLDTRVIVEAT